MYSGKNSRPDQNSFRPLLKRLATGPASLKDMDPADAELAMQLILTGEATPAQAAGFLLVGRAKGNSSPELAAFARAMQNFSRRITIPHGPPVVSVTGGFDGKLRTFNIGAAASLVAAAAGGKVLILGCEDTPPKSGRTSFQALRSLGVNVPHSLKEAGDLLEEVGIAVTTLDHYLPELYQLLPLRREMVVRTALNVSEKLVSPVAGSRFLVGVNHRSHVESIPQALAESPVQCALVVQAIEGSDEAPLDGNSALVWVREDKIEEFRITPESLGLPRATKAHIPWQSSQEESRTLLSALNGTEGPVQSLILYNAALRLWVGDPETALPEHLQRARTALESGAVLELLGKLRQAVLVPG